MVSKINVFWFRRDLRLQDNSGLFHALTAGLPVLPIFIFDRLILDEIEDKADPRVGFIHAVLEDMQENLRKMNSTLDVRYGRPLDIIEQLSKEYEIDTIFTNHDYEPYAIGRDEAVKALLARKGIRFQSFKDQVIFEKKEVVKDNGEPYMVFTPYSKKWKARLIEDDLKSFNTLKFRNNFLQQKPLPFPGLESIGFKETVIAYPSTSVADELIQHYHGTRDTPSVRGTSRLGLHLRFGTVSIRMLASRAVALNPIYLNELIWREFFMQLLWHFPRLVKEACKPEYEAIRWRNNEKEFERWCQGRTGYPIVDAGMRELNATGFMHNRVRMITASFLVKHLLVDWRWGEAYFAKKLLDFDLSSNNGNWQWVAGCGCDAAPYFRIFSPEAQTKKFDPELRYVRKWVAEFDSPDYPAPMVAHEFARDRCLAVYKKALGRGGEKLAESIS
ncbi:MAG TPA: deoxyribodipyrimidine photo-lyase [Flavisolibacter sp.]|nr:deoxyribodipyrimidine photo-lyase [Flavisolibacter sp.]